MCNYLYLNVCVCVPLCVVDIAFMCMCKERLSETQSAMILWYLRYISSEIEIESLVQMSTVAVPSSVENCSSAAAVECKPIVFIQPTIKNHKSSAALRFEQSTVLSVQRILILVREN